MKPHLDLGIKCPDKPRYWLLLARRCIINAFFFSIRFFNLFIVFTVFYPRYEKDHAPKSSRREKAAKWTNMAAKQVT